MHWPPMQWSRYSTTHCQRPAISTLGNPSFAQIGVPLSPTVNSYPIQNALAEQSEEQKVPRHALRVGTIRLAVLRQASFFLGQDAQVLEQL